MKRHIFKKLLLWKNNPQRKPLILRGARQVGKTYALTTFAKQEYENVAYLNFESNRNIHDLFKANLTPHDIIKLLGIELEIQINPKTTLIIFDEIQECPAALTSLKYFDELANNYHICAAGSLLGITLSKTHSFPVGKVDFLNLYPLNFAEFLEASNQENLLEYIKNIQILNPFPQVLHDKLSKYFKTYLFTGGMPAAVLEYTTTGDFQRTRTIQKNILDAYRLDFSKHAPSNSIMKINQVWDAIPNQLAKENKKFIYSAIRQGARAQEFEVAIQWLVEAGLIYKVYNVSTPKLPLNAYANYQHFKIYLADIGLLSAMANISEKTIIHGDTIFQEFHGALIENYAAQELACRDYWSDLFYWTSSGQAELDFIFQYEDTIYPLEVKAGQSFKNKSLQSYTQKYEPKLSIKTTPLNLKYDHQSVNCPLYCLGYIDKIIDVSFDSKV